MSDQTEPVDVWRLQLAAARERGDIRRVRELLAMMRRLGQPENTLAPRATETREED